MANVLLVEDDPLVYRMYQRVFKLEGLELDLVSNGQAALDRLQTFKADIILLDVMMPIMNGVQVLEKLQANPLTKDIPVVVLTNLSNSQITQEALAKGARQCIVKSETEPKKIIEIVKNTLAGPKPETGEFSAPL